MNCRILYFLVILILGFSSCITTYNVNSIQVEIMKPALFTFPDKIDTIAVFKRDFFQSDAKIYEYFDVDIKDTTINPFVQYSNLSNRCVDALAEHIDNEGYFLKVINYRDSLNYLFEEGDSLINYPELFRKLEIDACVFLDYFQLEDRLTNNSGYYFMNNFIEKFPEFRTSSKLEQIKANLFWTVAIEGDTAQYVCKLPDELFYGNSVYPEFFGNDLNHKLLLENTSKYLGKAFGAKIVPSWLKVERHYYRSNNTNMLQAEKYCLRGDYLKAAEIYNKETRNKNRNIAAKARYNMALVCEMEGKPDVGIDWLIRSYSAYKQENEEHKFNCKQYIDLLAQRKIEIERLSKQVRNR